MISGNVLGNMPAAADQTLKNGYMKKPPTLDLSKVDGFLPVSRCDRIRTCDLCVPNAALYQAEPRIDICEALFCLSNRA